MIHDSELLDNLAALPTETLEGIVDRVTSTSRDGTASSNSGRRWSFANVGVLYARFARDGARAEVVSYLSLLTPLPRKLLRVHRIQTATSKTPHLETGGLSGLGVDIDMERVGWPGVAA